MNSIIKGQSLLLAVSVALSLAACSKNEDISTDEAKGITETIALNVDTKVTLSDGLESAWEDGDKIAVWTGTSAESGSFQTCNVASYSIDVVLADASYHRFNYAAYYCGNVLPAYSAGTLSINLPAEYDYADVCGTKNPAPMVAKSLYTDGSTLTFHAVGALARIAVTGIPATANKLVVTFDKDVTGSFAVTDPSGAAPSISTSASSGKNTVTIALTPNTDYAGAIINIPVPTGTLSVTSIVAKLDDATVATVNSVITGWTAARTRGKKAIAAFTPSMASMILAPGNLYTSSGKLAISPNCYDHLFRSASAPDHNPDTYSCADRTHFNWNELYFIMSSTGLTTLPTSTDASTAHSGSYETLAKSDFGDGYTWHVPSSAEWTEIIHGPLTASRPGAKLTYILGSDAPVTLAGVQMTRIAITDKALETEGYQGVLLFPDNIEIKDAEFEDGNATNSINKSGAWTDELTISEDNLNALIAQGCAFLPTSGMLLSTNYLFTNEKLAVNYLTSTENASNPANANRIRIQNKSTVATQSYAKGGLWCSVRLARPVE